MSAVDTAFDLSNDRLKDQWATLRILTTKAGIMLGIAVCLAGTPVPKEAHGTLLLYALYASITLAGALGLLAIFPRSHGEGARMQKVAKMLRDYECDDARAWITEANIMASDHNATILNRIGAILSAGLVFLALSVALRITLQVIHSA